MRKRGKWFLGLAVLLANSALAGEPGWQLVWSDDFSRAASLDPAKWELKPGGDGGGNSEAQYYTGRPENVRVENGQLVVEARKEAYGGRDYTSGRLITRASWSYGRFVVRAKLPAGRGSWPAIWMMPVTCTKWPDCGEIDIMEHVGFDYGVVHGSLHMQAFNWVIGNGKTATIRVPGVDTEFHDYALEWSPELITMLVDGQPYFTFANSHNGWAEWPFSTPFYLILNVAVGGGWGGQHGIDDQAFPQRMTVKSVKVYKSAGGLGL
jgi:licheninase